MELETLQKYIGKVVRFLFGSLLFLLLLSLLLLEADKKPPEHQNKVIAEKVESLRAAANIPDPNFPNPWPPAMNQTYPDFVLIDQSGEEFKISDHEGKILLIELVDASSPISQGYSGAATRGTFGGLSDFDTFTKPIQTLIAEETEGRLTLPHPDIMLIKIIMRGLDNSQPTPELAENWAAHFGLRKSDNTIVAVPVKDMRASSTDKIIPGFQLTDHERTLRVDSAGPEPKHNLTMTLIPLIPKLIQ